ncbi:F19K23.17 protein isoform 3 [Theobroma cacao]|uniref:F19K23.17 protein isoform 3 n=1 Tax=Theobroma cacao TaxID=3641 RepID=A0A061GGR2_THECC|nr:F19K23.17 protein isoform 3 [Theobroma cacao]
MMLTVNPPGAIGKSQAAFLGNITLFCKLPSAAIFRKLPAGIHCNLPSWKDSRKLTTHHLVSHRLAPKRWLEFISAGVNAYALGCTDEGLRKELVAMKESGIEIEAMQNYGGSTSLKSKICAEEVDECILWLSIIFITILCTPQPTIVRWSSTPAVSDDVLYQWKGFCALIANAYYIRGMAWLPVKTLQLEQMAVVERAEEPSVVASRMRLVFSTLEVVSPQWPRV